jgi:hypothetical protein
MSIRPRHTLLCVRLASGCALLAAASAWALDCQGAPVAREAPAKQMDAFVRANCKGALGFMGYCGASCEDAPARLVTAEPALSQRDPARTMVNIHGAVRAASA